MWRTWAVAAWVATSWSVGAHFVDRLAELVEVRHVVVAPVAGPDHPRGDGGRVNRCGPGARRTTGVLAS
jgi:hypothetical protein